MALEGYQLRTQLGAGPDGIAYQATANDGVMTALVLDLSRARSDTVRWSSLVPRLRLASHLTHPSAKSVLELGLEEERPYAVLEWTGATTLATATSALLPSSERETMALVRSLAGVVAAAHRLGLAHGQLSADQVFLTAEGQIKLDFSGASVGFPHAGKPDRSRGAAEAPAEAGNLAALRSADLLRPRSPDRAVRSRPGRLAAPGRAAEYRPG